MLKRNLLRVMTLTGVLALAAPMIASTEATAATTASATASFPTSLLSSVPLARLHFSVAVSASQLPPVTTFPALATRWQQIGPNDVQAVTTGTLVPATNYLIDVPTRVSCTSSGCVATARAVRTIAALGSTQWLQELLATLGYLPVTFQPSNAHWSYSAPTTGVFTWRFANLPQSLRAQWRVGVFGVITKGAVMRFQNVSHLSTSGVADSNTWKALIAAAVAGAHNASGYNFVDVTMARPQTLTLYVNGKVTFRTTINTGIAQAPTEAGTFPVYLRYTSTTMSGTNPDGSHYHDTGIPWVSYFNGGDALHGFLRYSYGWPQSLGCVEMRYNDAHVIYPYTPIGTLVTVR